MDLKQLRYFVVLADELHFRRAAERLNMTQAPLSIAIQTMERELGGLLFHRTQRRVALTEIGQAFRERALDILDRVDQALLSFFPQMVSSFRAAFPKVQVTLCNLSSAEQVLALQRRDIDVAILRSQNIGQLTDISIVNLIRDPLIVAMRSDHLLSEKAALRIKDLQGVPMVFYPRGSGVGIYEQVMKLCAKEGFTPVIAQEAIDPSTIVGLAAAGLGVAVVPSELQCITVPNLTFKPLADAGAMTQLVMACRAGDGNALVARFRHMVQSSVLAWKREHDGFDALPA